MDNNAPTSKVFYRPVEAAIRWAGLLRYESEILSAIGSSQNPPHRLDYPRWNEFRLYIARIYDGVLNGELPFGQNGITTCDPTAIDSPTLTVRHLDLKQWMRRHYPEQRPSFLFTRCERLAHPVITMEIGQALLTERMALQSALKRYRRELCELEARYEALLKQSRAPPSGTLPPISSRSETTYLHIIGGMLELMLGHSPSGTPYSSFKTQEAIVSALVAHHPDGHPKLLHLWPVKLLQAGRSDYACSGVMFKRAAASLRR